MNFRELKALLTRAAINLFPEDDAFCYSEGRFVPQMLYE